MSPGTSTLRIGLVWLGLCLFLASGCGAEAERDRADATVDEEPIGELNLVPDPSVLVRRNGHLHLTADSRIAASSGAEPVAELLAARLRQATGFPFTVVTEAPNEGDIALVLDASTPGAADGEAYALAVTTIATIRARTTAGLFYGSQTLRQLLPAEVEGEAPAQGLTWRIPMVDIQDQPRFEWRGAMLDVARHFFGVADVKRLIDAMSHYKMNRLHLHLTDDQGWRIQIDSWPRLTSVGGATEVGGGPGGFYSKADYSEIVDYAASRFITVVPEIDMPGHTNAALASYGELNESGEPKPPYTSIGVGFSSLWVDGPATSRFVDDVIREVAELTPGPYFHIGGDEAAATAEEDYVRFIRSAQSVIEKYGKTMVGWEEVVRADLTAPFLAQHWLFPVRAVQAAEKGGRVISSPATSAYLDMKYNDDTPIGLSWAGNTDVEAAYRWDPVTTGLSEDNVIGLEAPLWTETVLTREDIDLLVFPRLLGHAEIAWSPKAGRSWELYRARLAAHGVRLEAMGIDYFRSPLVDWRTP